MADQLVLDFHQNVDLSIYLNQIQVKPPSSLVKKPIQVPSSSRKRTTNDTSTNEEKRQRLRQKLVFKINN
jgi:hypothetical protein